MKHEHRPAIPARHDLGDAVGLGLFALAVLLVICLWGSSARAAVFSEPPADSSPLDLNPARRIQAVWPGAAGVLQTSSNAVLWTELQPIATGGVVLVTNDAPIKLFRVRITK